MNCERCNHEDEQMEQGICKTCWTIIRNPVVEVLEDRIRKLETRIGVGRRRCTGVLGRSEEGVLPRQYMGLVQQISDLQKKVKRLQLVFDDEATKDDELAKLYVACNQIDPSGFYPDPIDLMRHLESERKRSWKYYQDSNKRQCLASSSADEQSKMVQRLRRILDKHGLEWPYFDTDTKESLKRENKRLRMSLKGKGGAGDD